MKAGAVMFKSDKQADKKMERWMDSNECALETPCLQASGVHTERRWGQEILSHSANPETVPEVYGAGSQ